MCCEFLACFLWGQALYIVSEKEIKFRYGKINLDRYMPFEEYLNFLAASDGLIMNTFRPQGYGNILMMMYLGKPVYFNPKNISFPDLNATGLKWMPIESLKPEAISKTMCQIKRPY